MLLHDDRDGRHPSDPCAAGDSTITSTVTGHCDSMFGNQSKLRELQQEVKVFHEGETLSVRTAQFKTEREKLDEKKQELILHTSIARAEILATTDRGDRAAHDETLVDDSEEDEYSAVTPPLAQQSPGKSHSSHSSHQQDVPSIRRTMVRPLVVPRKEHPKTKVHTQAKVTPDKTREGKRLHVESKKREAALLEEAPLAPLRPNPTLKTAKSSLKPFQPPRAHSAVQPATKVRKGQSTEAPPPESEDDFDGLPSAD